MFGWRKYDDEVRQNLDRLRSLTEMHGRGLWSTNPGFYKDWTPEPKSAHDLEFKPNPFRRTSHLHRVLSQPDPDVVTSAPPLHPRFRSTVLDPAAREPELKYTANPAKKDGDAGFSASLANRVRAKLKPSYQTPDSLDEPVQISKSKKLAPVAERPRPKEIDADQAIRKSLARPATDVFQYSPIDNRSGKRFPSNRDDFEAIKRAMVSDDEAKHWSYVLPIQGEAAEEAPVRDFMKDATKTGKLVRHLKMPWRWVEPHRRY